VPRGGREPSGKPFDGQPKSRGEGTTQPAGDRATGGGRARPADSATATSGDATTVQPYSRPRNGRPATGDAVERRPVGGVTPPIYIDGGYYPWGWGGLAFGGYYDPWLYGSYGTYPATYPSSYSYGYEGALRLKVKQRAAQVYVDGYYAGEVDDFDGMFQRLHLDAGPHRIEVRLDGYETLNFDVNIQPDQTVTYKGEMGRLP
jgi:hypothetical protein